MQPHEESNAEGISIHALREEGDANRTLTAAQPAYFYPRPPRGGRQTISWADQPKVRFLSTPSARRATTTHTPPKKEMTDFYPRPPRGGRPRPVLRCPSMQHFYPRPPRGGRPEVRPVGFYSANFYPRPPRGGRQGAVSLLTNTTIFLSTPSARRATAATITVSSKIINFYPRPPRGGRHVVDHLNSEKGTFLSTPSARRTTDSEK